MLAHFVFNFFYELRNIILFIYFRMECGVTKYFDRIFICSQQGVIAWSPDNKVQLQIALQTIMNRFQVATPTTCFILDPFCIGKIE